MEVGTDACLEALVEQRDCEEDAQVLWPECLWLVAQNGATPPSLTRLRVATPDVQVQTLLVGLVADVLWPSLLSMMGIRSQ